MQRMDDRELLQEYATQKSEAAFASLVARHINMVYSVALRHAGNAHHAEEIAQAVFVILAKKAASLSRGTILSGWLFHTARLTANNFLRTEIRRVRREQEAYMRSTLHETESEEWNRIAPLLDEAMADLGEKDRSAVVLRYVEGKDLKEVGAAFGASEEAAKKRVSRAVEKLRKFFTARGVMLSSTALTGAIAAHSVQAAPLGLAASVTAGAVQSSVLTASTLTLVKGTIKVMAWTKVKIAVGVGVAALVAVQWYEIANEKKELAAVRQELQQQRQAAETHQTTIAKLEQDKASLVEQVRSVGVAKTKLIAKQKAAVDSAAAAPGAGGKNLSANDLANIFDDPAANELYKVQVRQILKGQFSGFAKKTKISTEDAEKVYDIFIDNELKKRQAVAAVIRGELDADKAIQARDATRGDVDEQLKGLLGEDKFAQYKDWKRNAQIDSMMGGLKDELGDTPLTDDQKKSLREVLAKKEEIPEVDNIDLFRSKESMDAYYRQWEDRSAKIREQTASFLEPEQVQALGKLQTNYLNMLKSQMDLGKKMVTGAN
ncbi:MAG: polymerase, sigma-24 subunit, subfamily [Pedosphaera sp.]|nr:polymerase, sigma-24 subunit, subfamily [Pedosphaera sp.]